MAEIKKSAELSKDRVYRYSLSRIWDDSKPFVLFVGLNPSTADETEDDRTVRRCVGFARDWGYGGFYLANLFAYRATKPRDMMAAEEPVGPENDSYLARLSRQCGLTIAAWGGDGGYLGRDLHVLKMLEGIHVLGFTKDGFPRHPLFMRANTKPVRWKRNFR